MLTILVRSKLLLPSKPVAARTVKRSAMILFVNQFKKRSEKVKEHKLLKSYYKRSKTKSLNLKAKQRKF